MLVISVCLAPAQDRNPYVFSQSWLDYTELSPPPHQCSHIILEIIFLRILALVPCFPVCKFLNLGFFLLLTTVISLRPLLKPSLSSNFALSFPS